MAVVKILVTVGAAPALVVGLIVPAADVETAPAVSSTAPSAADSLTSWPRESV